jgi:hypothetical protein
MLLSIYTYVSSICFECSKYFRLMLQVFHLNVAKVDLDVAYVVMAIHACFKRMFQVFISFRRMLRIFYMDVLKVDFRGAYVAIAWCCCMGHCATVGHRATWCCVHVATTVCVQAWVTVPPAGAATVCTHVGT